MHPVNKKKLSIFGLLLISIIITACNVPRTLGGGTPIPTIDLPPTLVTEFPFVVGNLTTDPTPTSLPASGDTTIDWYVAPDGDNDNTCYSPEEPCLTISAALWKVRAYDRVDLAPGTYTRPGGSGPIAAAGTTYVSIIGAGTDATFIDGAGTATGFIVTGDKQVHISDLTVQNSGRQGCIRVEGSVSLTLENVHLRDCLAYGLIHDSSGLVNLIDVDVYNTTDSSTHPNVTINGYGIDNNGEMVIERGEIYANEADGIDNNGSLTITGTAIRDNFFHGLIHELGTAILNNVTVSGNATDLRRYAIHASSSIEINDSLITANLHKGIQVESGASLRMTNSTISNNSGTALRIESGATAQVFTSSIENNFILGTTIAAVYNIGDLLIDESQIINHRVSAIFNANGANLTLSFSEVSANNTGGQPAIEGQGPNGSIDINNSLIANNQTGSRPAIESDIETHILNSTISGNTGSGVFLGHSSSSISYSTIAENRNYGIDGSSGVAAHNTIIARNTPTDCSSFISDPVSALSGVNIDTDGSCGVEQTYTPAALLLGSLANNGGLTMTHALLTGSPAIDAALGSCPPVDQRDFGRPVGAGCDVGAYETGAVAAAPATAAEEEPGDATTITVNIPDTPCYTGPGPDWGFVNNFSAGTTMELVGAGFTGNGNQAWVVGSHPTAENVNCWLPGDNVTTGIPLGDMRLISVPPKPTPMPTPTPDETREPKPDEPTPCPLNGNGVPTC